MNILRGFECLRERKEGEREGRRKEEKKERRKGDVNEVASVPTSRHCSRVKRRPNGELIVKGGGGGSPEGVAGLVDTSRE